MLLCLLVELHLLEGNRNMLNHELSFDKNSSKVSIRIYIAQEICEITGRSSKLFLDSGAVLNHSLDELKELWSGS